MVKLYADRVENGVALWTAVPSLWQKKVCAELVKRGYILNDDGTVSKPEPVEETPDEGIESEPVDRTAPEEAAEEPEETPEEK